MSSIELRQVSRDFDARTRALDSVDLTVLDGERLVVLGPSGSGKTTILRLIAGLDQPTAGSVRLGDALVDGLPPHRRNVAMVFQYPTLYPHLDVAGNLEFGLKTRGVPRAERRRRIGEVAAMLKIDALVRRRPASLSGGERQRVAIGRAVVRRPAVLLLDEPFSSLDLPLRAALRRELIELHEAFRTTLVHVTHDQGEALSLGQRIAVLDRGRLIQVASPRELYERPASPIVAAFVGGPPMNLLPCTLVRDGSRTSVVVGERLWPISPTHPLPELADGESRAMLLGIRPEHLHVDPADALTERTEGFPAIESRIRRIEFQGDSVLLTLDLRGSTAVARVAASDDFHEGQSVVASPDLARAVWFSADN
ncbi:MAG: ABC transporter ATP-binding protein [Paludisphaera borealis]|uniref:ABC transporter ATP-binding protein n=1 Tax=Paludisphaera borealis TaxID=1387353 RepID=UPI00283C71FB|nr:ABC transporter ATP-binding protein [Paludisphaera borealis]MDR3623288.1 ABC transporter ATP-binding protein [Paludisphaera borealis]